ncbi:hypothetical protein CPB86DRAFT_791194 [Serendipita vermifera]|nr:hypothetical protein CPB86DRAFT_791194 [Serendipita vermifera]
MFSSFSKFLPQNVSINTPDFLKLNQPSTSSTTTPPTTKPSTNGTHHVKEPDSQTSTTAENESLNERERRERPRRRKDTSATETFMIVRPPPSKTNHPLNLQVQLVASSNRDRLQRRSGSSTEGGAKSANASRETLNDPADTTLTTTPTTNINGLQRTPSIKSMRSEAESTYSASSTLSSTSTTSGRKMIPLYNLHAHNVMTNVITDAGTDAKIAKFSKRGLEIIGLAIVEPVEVYGTYAWTGSFDALQPMGPGSGTGGGVGVGLGTQVTKTLSQFSNLSIQRTISPVVPAGLAGAQAATGGAAPAHSELSTVTEVPSPTTPRPTNNNEKDKEGPGKKLLGFFNKKKKEPPAPLALTSSLTSVETPPPSAPLVQQTPISSKRKSITPSVVVSSPQYQQSVATPTTAGLGMPSGGYPTNIPSITGNITTGTAISGPGGGEVLLQPQILGLQAVIQSPIVPPRGRPNTYVWVARRWIKGSGEEGILGAVADSLGIGSLGNMLHPPSFANPSSQKENSNSALGGSVVEIRFEWKRSSKSRMGASSTGGDRRRRNETESTIGQDERKSRRYSSALEVSSSSLQPPKSSSGFSTKSADRHVQQQQIQQQQLAVSQDTRASDVAAKRRSFQGFGRRGNQDSPDEELKVGDLHVPRAPSPNPPASVTTTNTTEENVPHTARTIQEEEEDDSDPEDSERPWNCYLHIRNVSSNRSRTWSRRGSRDELVRIGSTGEEAERRQQSEEESVDIKLRIACLAPAPHHPKVVAQFKVPYPLPDVVVDPRNAPGVYLKTREPHESRVDLGEMGANANGSMVVTAEELKDIICCTGLWLVVREGYGGLTKKRKGDGWRLRG